MSYKNRKCTEQVLIIIACMSQAACPTSLAYIYTKGRNSSGTTVTALLIWVEGCQFDATELHSHSRNSDQATSRATDESQFDSLQGNRFLSSPKSRPPLGLT